MRDVVFILITVGFFALTAGVVQLCDRIVGPDVIERSDSPPGTSADLEAVA